MESQTERAFPIAKKVVEMVADVSAFNQSLVFPTSQLYDAVDPKWSDEYKHSAATTIHATISNFAYNEVNVAKAKLQLGIYDRLARELSTDALAEVHKALGVQVLFAI